MSISFYRFNSISIPDSVITIGRRAFAHNEIKSITIITIGADVDIDSTLTAMGVNEGFKFVPLLILVIRYSLMVRS